MADLSQRTDNAWATAAGWAAPALTAWGEAGGACLKACAAWQQEMSRFIGARVEADIAAQKSLVECGSLADAAKLQQEWAAATVNDYVNETSRLMEIAARCIPAASAPMTAANEKALRGRAAE